MLISTWRYTLTNWLEANVAIDSWFLDTPGLSQTLAFVPPLQRAAIANTPQGLQAEGVQAFHLRRRYPRNIRYSELPLGDLEATWLTLALRAIAAGYGWGLSNLEILSCDPVAVIETSGSQSDWTIELSWRLGLTWPAIADPAALLIGAETGNVPAYPVSQIAAGLYAQPLIGGPNVLDVERLILP